MRVCTSGEATRLHTLFPRPQYDTYVFFDWVVNANDSTQNDVQMFKDPPWSFKIVLESTYDCKLLACVLMYKLDTREHVLWERSRAIWDPRKETFKLTSRMFTCGLNNPSTVLGEGFL